MNKVKCITCNELNESSRAYCWVCYTSFGDKKVLKNNRSVTPGNIAVNKMPASLHNAGLKSILYGIAAFISWWGLWVLIYLFIIVFVPLVALILPLFFLPLILLGLGIKAGLTAVLEKEILRFSLGLAGLILNVLLAIGLYGSFAHRLIGESIFTIKDTFGSGYENNASIGLIDSSVNSAYSEMYGLINEYAMTKRNSRTNSLFQTKRSIYPQSANEISKVFSERVPYLKLRHHPKTNDVISYGDICPDSLTTRFTLKDTGKWVYVDDTTSRCFGSYFIDCTHRDGSGRPYYRFGNSH